MKYMTLLNKETVRPSAGKKILPSEEFSTLLTADELLKKVQEEAIEYRSTVAKECEVLKEEAEMAGFESGNNKWIEQIHYLEKEQAVIRAEMEEAIVPLAMAAVKKILGKELELRNETIVDIVATALKAVSQHHRITIYVRKADLDILEENRPRLKAIFENLKSLTIAPRDDIDEGSCIIETEVGIINARLDYQLKALEVAFHDFLKNNNKKETP